MIVIPLSKGLHTIVDDDCDPAILALRWYAKQSGYGGHFYAVSKSLGRENTRLHRLIANPSKGLVVDHINGNTLDNRKAILRVCTTRQNLLNRRTNRNSPCGFRGVKTRQTKKGISYRAAIVVD